MKKLILFIALVSLLQVALAQQGELMPLVFPAMDNASGLAKATSGFICTYAAGTTTPLATYTDAGLTSANQNPIRLNSAGRPVNGSTEVSVFFAAQSYKLILYAAGTGNTCNGTTVGALIKSVDNAANLAQLIQAASVELFGATFDNNADATLGLIIQAGATTDQDRHVIFRNYLGANRWTIGVNESNHFGVDSNLDGSNRIEVNYNEAMVFRAPSAPVSGSECGRFDFQTNNPNGTGNIQSFRLDPFRDHMIMGANVAAATGLHVNAAGVLEMTSGITSGTNCAPLISNTEKFRTGGYTALSTTDYSYRAFNGAGNPLLYNFLVGSDTQPAFRIAGNGVINWGAGGSTAVDTQLSRAAANTLQLGTGDTFRPEDASGQALGDTSHRFGPSFIQSLTLGASGTVTVSSGSGAPGGACTTGSIYQRTDGAANATSYDCEGTVWTARDGAVVGTTGTVFGSSHHVIGSCILGTSCAVTLTGAAVFTNSGSYVCTTQDETNANPTKLVRSSGSAFTITGTGTDSIAYHCVGN